MRPGAPADGRGGARRSAPGRATQAGNGGAGRGASEREKAASAQRGRKRPVSESPRGGVRGAGSPGKRPAQGSVQPPIQRAGERGGQGRRQRPAQRPAQRPEQRPEQRQHARGPQRRTVRRGPSPIQLIFRWILVLGILAAIIFGLYKAGSFALQWYKDYKARSSSTTQEQVVLHDPVACSTTDLKASLREMNSTAGQPVKFHLEITNTGEVPCLLEVGERELGVKVTSGDVQVSNTLGCIPKSAEKKRLLLTNGDTAKVDVNWDGKVQNSNCDGRGPESKPGTYRGQIVTPDGALGEEEITFVLK